MAMIDEIKKETAKMKDMTGKERWEYFWEYYKVHTIVAVCVIFFLVSFTKDVLTNKQPGLYFAMLNCDTTTLAEETTDTWSRDLEAITEMNTKKNVVEFDTALSLSPDQSSQFDYSTMSKLMALAGARTLDVMAANTANFEFYAQSDYFYNLEEVLPADLLEKVSPYLYYTDAAGFPKEAENLTMEQQTVVDTEKKSRTIDHHKPEDMEQPVAVGIFVEASEKLRSSGAYTYLSDVDKYQGYPQEGVLGIAMSTDRMDMVLKALDYLFE